MAFGFVVVLLISALGGWWATRSLKKKLAKSLGRKVDDSDVTSISAWMKADDKTLDSVVRDDSPEHRVQDAMENIAEKVLGDGE